MFQNNLLGLSLSPAVHTGAISWALIVQMVALGHRKKQPAACSWESCITGTLSQQLSLKQAYASKAHLARPGDIGPVIPDTWEVGTARHVQGLPEPQS